MTSDLEEIRKQAEAEIAGAVSEESLLEIRTRYLGGKDCLQVSLRTISTVPQAERPAFGQRLNEGRMPWTSVSKTLSRESSPPIAIRRSSRNKSMSRCREGRFCRVGCTPSPGSGRNLLNFFGAWFSRSWKGPEVETDYYNFEALNIPKDHPAGICRTPSTSKGTRPEDPYNHPCRSGPWSG